MGELESDEGLPPGWTVEVKQRKDGRKDKYYFPPSGNSIFRSKLEVLRYLEKEKGIARKSSENVTIEKAEPEGLPPEWTKEVKVTKKGGRVRRDLVIEKAEPEGLPPGWTKEVKVTKKGGRVRRDSSYTDPASRYIFRSMKDVRRYLETGEIGRLAKKPKDKGHDESELENPKTSSPALARKGKLEDGETTITSISDESTKLRKSRNGDKIIGDSVSVYDQKSHHCRGGKETSRSESPKKNNQDQREEKTDSSKSRLVLTHEVGAVQTKKQSPETAVASGKIKKEKDLNQPRRASKRLAGVPLEPTPELKTPARALRSAVKEFSEMVTTNSEASSSKQGHASDVKTKNQGNQAVAEQINKKGNSSAENGSSSVNKSDRTNNLSFESRADGNYKRLEDMVKAEIVNKGSTVPPSLKSEATEQNGGKDSISLGDLWQDPCIAFAIKTLTGTSVDEETNPNTKAPQVSSGSGFKYAEPQQETATGAGGVGAKPDEKPESTINVPLVAEVFADPCIEFAIKTLTGAIPLDYLLPQVSRSSGMNGENATKANRTAKSVKNGLSNQRPKVEERSRKRRK